MSYAASVRSESTFKAKDDDRSTIKDQSPTFKYEFLDGDDEEDAAGTSAADTSYSLQLESILAGENENEEEEVEEEEFVYSGKDASELGGYHEQLANVLGYGEADQEGEELEFQANEQEQFQYTLQETLDDEALSDRASLRSRSNTTSPPPARTATGSSHQYAFKPSQISKDSLLHPNVSRLRSFTPQRPQFPSISSAGSNLNTRASPSASHFSSISRASSTSNLHSLSESQASTEQSERKAIHNQEAFRLSTLRIIGSHIFPTTPAKASATLGSSWGNPTVMAANGLICIGTDQGKTLVYDFRQQFKFSCGTEQNSGKPLGAVSALALSHDRTFLAVGYEFGHINLFDLSKPQTPSRSVPPTTITSVASGRKEGHIQGSRVNHLGFVGARHTAIVSSDDDGLAFYHSLGKVLFVEANDVLRVLGKYPEERPILPAAEASLPASRLSISSFASSLHIPAREAITTTSPQPRAPKRNRRSTTSILSMAPLPLGTIPHPTDSYQIIALLTPIKLVIVGLKPTPRTWYRRHRDIQEESQDQAAQSQWRGCLAWYPSVVPSTANVGDPPETVPKTGAKTVKPKDPTTPMLVYSWGKLLHLIRVREERVQQKVLDEKAGGGKKKLIEVGKLVFDEVNRWATGSDIVAIQWLNLEHLLVLTMNSLEVFEVKTAVHRVEKVPLDATSLVSTPPTTVPSDLRVTHSIKVYKGKVFMLGSHDLRAGTLLSWADRILSFVQDGDFLSAIELARSYYVGEAPGNKTGLPDDPPTLRRVVGQKLRDLMAASASYAFSEDRMTDGTHYTPDGRGVDRTALFEGLVTRSVQASISLDDFDFLWEDLFEKFSSSGIVGVFLAQLEPFVLDGSLPAVPPYVTQQLVAMHEEKGDYAKAEKIIWHIDPASLDVNQAITLCRRFELYDALIYVYTRALEDFVSPFVELLGLVRKVQQIRRELGPRIGGGDDLDESLRSSMERLVPNAYKIYGYLGNILSGLTYPSEKPMPDNLALRAKKELYPFIFYGRSSVWPFGSEGTLVLTADEEGGTEPTYPYLRLLLKFDAEAFLHSMDIAFEDSYLNDMGSQGVVTCQIIVNVLLEIISSSSDFTAGDITFINIFIARNVPKYPQFIQITPSALQSILLDLAQDHDPSTREDRQLAAEFLLSVFTPHNRDRLLAEFERAGFYRILRSWYQKDRKWSHLLSTYLRDPDIAPSDLFSNVGDVLITVSRGGKNELPPDVKTIAVDSLPQLLENSITNTAYLVDKFFPDSHQMALTSTHADEQKQFIYLRALIEPEALEDDIDWHSPLPGRKTPSLKLDSHLRHLYVSLTCRYEPDSIIPMMESLPKDYIDPTEAVPLVQEAGEFDAVVWLLNRQHEVRRAFDVIASVGDQQAAQLARCLTSENEIDADDTRTETMHRLTSVVRMGLRVCLEHSKGTSLATQDDMKVEDMWFQLFRGQIEVVQSIASVLAGGQTNEEGRVGATPIQRATLEALRSLTQEIFSSLVSQTSSRDLSFPLLFKRLVDSTSASRASNKGLYAEFRLILTGMLESYRFEGDFLGLSKRLVERDLYDSFSEHHQARVKGWRPSHATCPTCAKSLFSVPRSADSGGAAVPGPPIVVLRSGAAYHRDCNLDRSPQTAPTVP